MKFIFTKELGRLTRWLRILGFDSIYYEEDDLGALLILALRENRKIITRSKNLNFPQKCMVVVESDKLKQQLEEVISKLGLKIDEEKLFSRCTICNEELVEAKKEAIKNKIPPDVYKCQDYFMKCQKCDKVYWRGTHWGNIKEAIGKVT